MRPKALVQQGSILLLTVMIMAVLTTVTLGGIAVRFQQLAGTDSVTNATIAKQAADSALADLRAKLTNHQSINSTIINLSGSGQSTAQSTNGFNPAPNSIYASYEPVTQSLPRCLAVAVLSPWVNGGQYLYQGVNTLQDTNNGQKGNTNPALLFHYANIVNDTTVGTVAKNSASFGGVDQGPDDSKTISQLTNMGHFYNPYATVDDQSQPNYWEVRLGGPDDQFLTTRSPGADPTSASQTPDNGYSYYSGLDFVYVPYLPRFQATALPSSKGLALASADTYRQTFENVIKSNNMRLWLDASVSDSLLYSYGLGDLFTGDKDYQVSWNQPSLWNDVPEADNNVYQTTNGTDTGQGSSSDPLANTAVLQWSKIGATKASGLSSGGWNTSILHSAVSQQASFFSVNASATNNVFKPSATVDVLVYGSTAGLRVNQLLTLQLYADEAGSPVQLTSRGTGFQGQFYNAKINNINLPGIGSTNPVQLSIVLSSSTTDTPNLLSGGSATASDVKFGTFLSTVQSQASIISSSTGVTLANSGTVVIASIANCGSSTICPAVGDVVDFTNGTDTPLWGQVSSATYASSGTTLATISFAQLYQSPPPLKDMAVSPFTDTADGNKTKVAVYGGSFDSNTYDGGTAAELDQLWIYDPANSSSHWKFTPPAGSTLPSRLAGASITYDPANNRLILFGGYYHRAIGCSESNLTPCITGPARGGYLPGTRMDKYISNDTYIYTLTGASAGWSKADNSYAAKITPGTKYVAKTLSTIGDRSGADLSNIWHIPIYKNLTLSYPIAANVDLHGPSGQYTSLAGLAKGDQVTIAGGTAPINIYATVTDVNYQNDTASFSIAGYSGSGTLKPTNVVIYQNNRNLDAGVCSGGIDASLGSYCQLTDTTGYSIGDAVVLEQYSSDNITGDLFGYVSAITSNRLYFVPDEKTLATAPATAATGDFTAPVMLNGTSALALPAARYGATLGQEPTSPLNKFADLVQGSQRNNIYGEASFSTVWKFNENLASPTKNQWQLQTMSNPVPPSANKYYVEDLTLPRVFTLIAKNDAANNGLSITPNAGVWDNNRTWTIDLNPGDLASIADPATILIQMFDSSGKATQTFHAVVDHSSELQSASNQLVVKHNSNYGGDSGFASGVSNAYMYVDNTIFGVTPVTGATAQWNTATGTFDMTLPSTSIGDLPVTGSMIVLYYTGTPGMLPAYTFVVKDRVSYAPASGGNYFFRLTPTGKLSSTTGGYVASPVSLYDTPTTLVSDGTSPAVLSLSNYNLPLGNFSSISPDGAAEWYVQLTGSAPSWQIRDTILSSNRDNMTKSRVGARQGAGMTTVYDPANTKPTAAYVSGGNEGVSASLWQELNAGANGNSTSRWVDRNAAKNSPVDIPNTFGARLAVYKNPTGTNIAIYFGGKVENSLSATDSGITFGVRDSSTPDIDRYYLSDGQRSNLSSINRSTAGIPSSILLSLQLTATQIPAAGKYGGAYTKTVCPMLAMSCDKNSQSPPVIENLGSLGRISGGLKSYPNGGSYSRALMITGEGNALTSNGNLILSGPQLPTAATDGLWQVDGYYPTGTTSGANNRALVLSALTKLTDPAHTSWGGSLLVTSVGVGQTFVRNGNNTYSYCAQTQITGGAPVDYTCLGTADPKLSMKFIPDPEDLLFTLDAASTLSATDEYKVVGYYGGVKRGYLVISRFGQDLNVQEIAP